jgi:hypothetical protein
MRVVDLVQQLIPLAQKEPQLQVVVRGLDDRGNEIDIKLMGTVRLTQDQWGTYILLK